MKHRTPQKPATINVIEINIKPFQGLKRHDWENRIDMDVLTQTCGTAEHAYLRFRAADCVMSIDSVREDVSHLNSIIKILAKHSI